MNHSPKTGSNPGGGRRGADAPESSLLERLTLVHLAVLVTLSSWAFGGGAPWARFAISAWGSLALLIGGAEIFRRVHSPVTPLRPLRWLWPLILFNALVACSCFNPSFTPKVFGGEALLAYTGPAHAAVPSSVHPGVSLAHLWLFDAIYLSCFNLLLTVRRRRALRGLLVAVALNGVVLAVFGTFQKLTSDGLFFGRVPSPNPRFFATFIYGNHWSAYVALLFAASIGLLLHYGQRDNSGAPIRGSVGLGLIGLLLMAVTPALAGSRAGVALILLVGMVAVCDVLLRALRRLRSHGESAGLPVAALALVVFVTVGGAFYLGRDSLEERWNDTRGQWRTGILGERIGLYSDTWQLVRQRPLFGWGLGSFEQALQLLRPRPVEERRQYEHSYIAAHSDGLQSLAETGFVGTVLLILCGVVPFRQARAAHGMGRIPAYLLGGCGVVLLYSLVEFPFGNAAVLVAFWLCFDAALQYIRLRRTPHP
ncbi:MAG: hypothetical protein JWM88_3296 [Verrucomicrobia bacterium]|nr:hypothetical protein [Verrucomicrobiota bacterium]